MITLTVATLDSFPPSVCVLSVSHRGFPFPLIQGFLLLFSFDPIASFSYLALSSGELLDLLNRGGIEVSDNVHHQLNNPT